VNLVDAADRKVKTYSGGMRRRLDLGASLVGTPRLLLLDEPTTGLDPGSRIELWDAIRDLGNAGTDIVLTTQYLDEADHLAASIVIIDEGRVIAQGTPGELKSRAGSDRIELHTREQADLAEAVLILSGTPASPRPTRPPAGARCRARWGPASARRRAGPRPRAHHGGGHHPPPPTLDEVFLVLTGHTTTTDTRTKEHVA
jgi:ABC-2 type transport system ATP-binding protein